MNDNELDNLMVLTYCKEQGQFQIETALNEVKNGVFEGTLTSLSFTGIEKKSLTLIFILNISISFEVI